MTKHRVSFADEALNGLQLGLLRIFAGGFGCEGCVQNQPFELADLVLIQRADCGKNSFDVKKESN